jgi:hypothetical protein
MRDHAPGLSFLYPDVQHFDGKRTGLAIADEFDIGFAGMHGGVAVDTDFDIFAH